MRTVYTNDQTDGFIEMKDYVWALGDFILKGKPYNNPKDAVDKDYVDNAFKNVSENNLKNRIPNDKYPAFNGDLINKAGTNNFQLKTVVKAANKVHRFTVDNKGRVTGYKTGKFIFDAKDFDKIDFDKIDYPSTGSITDYLPNFNFNDFLTVAKENVISKPLDMRTKYPRGEHDVLSLKETIKASEKYFTGKMVGVKTDGLNKIELEVDTVDGYDNIGGTPWRTQIGMTPFSEDMFGTKPDRIIDLTGKWHKEHRDPKVFILNKYIHLVDIDYRYDDEVSICYKIPLLPDGTIEEDPEFIENILPNMGDDVFEDGTNDKRFYLNLSGKHLNITLANNWSQWRFLSIVLDDDENFSDEWAFKRPSTMDNGIYYADKLINVRDWMASSYYVKIDRNDVKPIGAKNLPVSVNSSTTGKFNSSRLSFTLGPYVYSYFSSAIGFGKSVSMSERNNYIQRVSLANGVPYGESNVLECPNMFPRTNHIYTKPITLTGGIVFVTTRNMTGNKTKVTLSLNKYDKQGRLTFIKDVTLDYEFERGGQIYVALSKSRLFIVTRKTLVSFPFKGVTNDYRKYVTDEYWRTLPGHK